MRPNVQDRAYVLEAKAEIKPLRLRPNVWPQGWHYAKILALSPWPRGLIAQN